MNHSEMVRDVPWPPCSWLQAIGLGRASPCPIPFYSRRSKASKASRTKLVFFRAAHPEQSWRDGSGNYHGQEESILRFFVFGRSLVFYECVLAAASTIRLISLALPFILRVMVVGPRHAMLMCVARQQLIGLVKPSKKFTNEEGGLDSARLSNGAYRILNRLGIPTLGIGPHASVTQIIRSVVTR